MRTTFWRFGEHCARPNAVAIDPGRTFGPHPTAVALAMAGARGERADAFLKDQQALIAAQLHHLAMNQSHLALAKFAQAEKYAPNWGRLHLKWGEALVFAGRAEEARAQFARAAQLDLSAADKAELARQQPHA